MTREEAIEFIAQSVKSDVDMAKVADAIEALKQKPKIGHWMDDCGGVKCSCCGYCIDDDYYAKTYCTNCGCRMESEVTP